MIVCFVTGYVIGGMMGVILMAIVCRGRGG